MGIQLSEREGANGQQKVSFVNYAFRWVTGELSDDHGAYQLQYTNFYSIHAHA